MTLGRVLKEPLLHFLLLGALLFTAYGMVSRAGSAEPGRIVITQGELASLREGFVRTQQRLPTSQEWEGLIRDRVREEVYYREALALGMDKDDIIIRRRLRQKMEFVTDDVVARAQPTEAELDAYLKAHQDKFRVASRLTFSQVYLNPQKHGDNLARDAAQLLAQLQRDGARADVSRLGDSLMLDHTFDALPASEVASMFGATFAANLSEITPGQWQGPVVSGYGAHLVFVAERAEGRIPALAEVRDAVSREWTAAQRREATESLYAAMLGRYVVTVERPEAATDKQKVGMAK